jgi:hypothetical protein
MSKLYTKNTWADEILADVERYRIADDDDVTVHDNVIIELKTGVITPGSPVTAAVMNNIEDGLDAVDSRADALLTHLNGDHSRLATIQVILGDGVNVLSTGVKGFLEVPFDCVIEAATLLADVSGSVVVDVWKDTYANFPPTVADTITASAKPTLSSAQKAQNTTLTGWTTALTKGDILAFNVDSASTLHQVTLSLRVRKTAVS